MDKERFKEGNLGSLGPSSSQNTFPVVNKGGSLRGTVGSLRTFLEKQSESCGEEGFQGASATKNLGSLVDWFATNQTKNTTVWTMHWEQPFQWLHQLHAQVQSMPAWEYRAFLLDKEPTVPRSNPPLDGLSFPNQLKAMETNQPPTGPKKKWVQNQKQGVVTLPYKSLLQPRTLPCPKEPTVPRSDPPLDGLSFPNQLKTMCQKQQPQQPPLSADQAYQTQKKAREQAIKQERLWLREQKRQRNHEQVVERKQEKARVQTMLWERIREFDAQQQQARDNMVQEQQQRQRQKEQKEQEQREQEQKQREKEQREQEQKQREKEQREQERKQREKEQREQERKQRENEQREQEQKQREQEQRQREQEQRQREQEQEQEQREREKEKEQREQEQMRKDKERLHQPRHWSKHVSLYETDSSEMWVRGAKL